jgi:biotin carboxyl carrier protein
MRKMTLVSGGTSIPVEVGEEDGKLWVRLFGERPAFDLVGETREGSGRLWSIVLGGRQYEVQVSLDDGQIVVDVEGVRYSFERQETSRAPTAHRHGGSADVTAPMPGKVVKLLAVQGESVEANQGILLFEAMKMQNEIRSPLAGRLVAVAVREGQAVESRERLFTVRKDAGAE